MIGDCRTCAAFHPAPDQAPGAGFCRRNPPIPIMQTVQVKPTPANPQGIAVQLTGQFTPVHESGGCCQYLGKNLLAS